MPSSASGVVRYDREPGTRGYLQRRLVRIDDDQHATADRLARSVGFQLAWVLADQLAQPQLAKFEQGRGRRIGIRSGSPETVLSVGATASLAPGCARMF